MNWFKRHLNWTLTLVWLVCFPLAIVFINAIRVSILGSATLESLASAALFHVIATVILCGFIIWVTVWVIRRKGRSPLHMFWIFLWPFGLIPLLLLKNYKEE